MRFIGHLDFLRTFQKIFRKAAIDISFTGGFSPHPIFSIAAPLAVGVTSEGEYLDLELDHDMEMNTLVQKMNECCPDGLIIVQAFEIADKEPSAMSLISASKYIILQVNPRITKEIIVDFMLQEQINMEKETKSGHINQVDIKRGIHYLDLVNELIIMTIATGSSFNIKPEVVLQALCQFVQLEYNARDYKVHRIDLYHGSEVLESMSKPVL